LIIKIHLRLNLFNELGIKLALSSETDVESREFKDPEIVRNKHRFTWKDSLFQYDLTQVTSTQKGKSTESVWEFEIELISSLLKNRSIKLTEDEKETIYVLFYKLYLKTLEMIKVINNSDMVYKRSEKTSVQRFVNDSVNAGRYKFDEFITKPQKPKDLRYGVWSSCWRKI
jgi:replication initiation and membrane attachment protein DnaB